MYDSNVMYDSCLTFLGPIRGAPPLHAPLDERQRGRRLLLVEVREVPLLERRGQVGVVVVVLLLLLRRRRRRHLQRRLRQRQAQRQRRQVHRRQARQRRWRRLRRLHCGRQRRSVSAHRGVPRA